MNKAFKYIIMSIPVLAFTACQSEDDMESPSNDKGMIMFSVDAEQVTSRAADGYEDYTTTNRPDNMGVWGYDSQNAEIFTNQKVTYSDSKWTYSPTKYWAEYASSTSFDFFAYMPQTTGASITNSGDSYTISFPVTIADGVTTNETALICHTPYHTEISGQTIPFQMDQTLTGFRVEFKLGDKMDEIRDFTITGVKIMGDKNVFASRGTVSRTYTYSNGWTAGDITWSNTTTHPSSDPEVIVDGSNLVLNKTEFKAWENNFYAIPVTGFTPTIQVTYDVTLNGTTDDSGNYTAGTVTRTDVVSTIKLCKKNFSEYDESKAGSIGKITPIQIKIVPSYLYVLADEDLESGYIVIK